LFGNNAFFVCLLVCLFVCLLVCLFVLINKNEGFAIFLGGKGGLGGRGAKCKRHGKWCKYPCTRRCKMKGQTAQAARGPPGEKGRDGQS